MQQRMQILNSKVDAVYNHFVKDVERHTVFGTPRGELIVVASYSPVIVRYDDLDLAPTQGAEDLAVLLRELVGQSLDKHMTILGAHFQILEMCRAMDLQRALEDVQEIISEWGTIFTEVVTSDLCFSELHSSVLNEVSSLIESRGRDEVACDLLDSYVACLAGSIFMAHHYNEEVFDEEFTQSIILEKTELFRLMPLDLPQPCL